jgi:hypothetical protein
MHKPSRQALRKYVLRAAVGLAAVASATFVAASPASAITAVTFPVSGSAYELSDEASPYCMQVPTVQRNPGTWNGTSVSYAVCNAGWDRQFIFEHIGVLGGKDSWRIHPRYAGSNQCLDIPGGTTNDAYIQVWACNGNWQQNFQLRRVGDGSIQINPIYDDACIAQQNPDVYFPGLAYTTACTYSPHIAQNQSWVILLY